MQLKKCLVKAFLSILLLANGLLLPSGARAAYIDLSSSQLSQEGAPVDFSQQLMGLEGYELVDEPTSDDQKYACAPCLLALELIGEASMAMPEFAPMCETILAQMGMRVGTRVAAGAAGSAIATKLLTNRATTASIRSIVKARASLTKLEIVQLRTRSWNAVELMQRLNKLGYAFESGKGDHLLVIDRINGAMVTVVPHARGGIATGTAKSIWNAIGLPKAGGEWTVYKTLLQHM